jgi:cobalt/nickel transport system ATP-binding protein
MILIQNVSYTYPSSASPALADVSLHIAKNETIAIVGANGAGKSTLLQLLCGLILPQTGSIGIDGIPLSKKTLEAARRKTGYLFQNPDDQLLMPTVSEDVAFSLRSRGADEQTCRQKTEEALQRLNISRLADRPPHKLSWGEKRMAAIAALLVTSPQALLMDEPTSFLDIRARQNFIEAIAAIPVAKIIATHDLEMALAIADTAAVLCEGRIMRTGKPQDILSDAALMAQAGLMVPAVLKKCPYCGR